MRRRTRRCPPKRQDGVLADNENEKYLQNFSIASMITKPAKRVAVVGVSRGAKPLCVFLWYFLCTSKESTQRNVKIFAKILQVTQKNNNCIKTHTFP